MRDLRLLCVHALLASALLATGAGRADAALITLTFDGRATGMLDPFGSKVSFTDAAYTVTAVADTDRPFPKTGFSDGRVELFNASVTIAIAGIGTGTVPGLSSSFVSGKGYTGVTDGKGFAGVGFLNSGGFFFALSPAFLTYALDGPIGPISVDVDHIDPIQVQTSLGVLLFTPAATGTFQATPSAAVPEPSSLALCGVAGISGLAVARARRKPAG